jgi:CRISPR-associated endonuclease/helicase Cas3
VSTAELSPGDFAAFFRAVHGADPFPWQQRLLDHIAAEGIWPDVLDLPTGAGKTAAIDIAVFHLALDATSPERRAPVRIAFVVDRRLIVDDAFARAEKLGNALAVSDDPAVACVAAALRRLAGSDAKPLMVRRLRGGVPREDDWARTPIQPTVLCSTVDQVGSRLLFRGYGVSDRMKPVHAGLLGSDCLILLDEAHLAEPFRQVLVKGVARLRGDDDAPWGTALLTATPGNQGDVQFQLLQQDREHPILARRLVASKPARLKEVAGKQGVPSEAQRTEEIAEHATAALRALRETISNPAIGVVVNRVARARAVFERIKHELHDLKPMLIIGPARQVDREALGDELAQIRTGGGAARQLEQPLIIVATQTIEAGVDIDLDGLVTEAAPLDALRQRFGRVNRAGRSMTAVAAILVHKEDLGSKADDPVYGDRIAKTWNALLAAGGPDGSVDFGIEAFPRQLIDAAADLVSPKPDAPVLLPAYADLWSQTSPIPNADPEIALFLHGPDRSPASVQLVWRADITKADLDNPRPEVRSRLVQLLGLVPPRAAEAIEVPLWAARAWLRESYQALAALADVAERSADDENREGGRRAFCFAGPDHPRTGPVVAGDIRPGDVLIVPAEYGGCDEWGWNPESTRAVKDMAEAAGRPYWGRRAAMRVTPALIRQFAQADNEAGTEEAALRLPSVLGEYTEEKQGLLVLEAILDRLPIPEQLHEELDALRGSRAGRLEPHFAYGFDEEGPVGIVFLAPFGLRVVADRDEAAAPATESDDLGSLAGYAQPLDEHSSEVEHRARDFAESAGLPAAIADDIALAAYLHDAGKADPRFQAYLAGGDRLGWDDRKVLAKSGRSTLPRNAWDRAELPPRWRHEALSVRLARLHDDFVRAHDPLLVLWLVGVHHGFGRPLFPHQDPLDGRSRADLPPALGMDWRLEPDAGPQSLAFDFDGRDWAQIFEELKQRYGLWGLARLEAFVRLADHRASEAAARHYADRPAEKPV